MVVRFDAVRLFILVLIQWTLQPHFTLRLSARTLVFVWGRAMSQGLLSYCTWSWPGLDSVSYSGCSVVSSVTGYRTI